MLRIHVLCLMLIALAWGPAWAQNADDGSEVASDEEVYLIRPGDLLNVSVLEDPNLSQQILVRPDGRISMPLAGTLSVEGRSPEEVQEAISTALREDFIEPPTVTVSLVSLGTGAEARVVYVIGQVNSPGPKPYTDSLTALQALALAGGPGVFAAADRIQIRRHSEEGGEILLFNYEEIEEGAGIKVPVPLSQGDVIVVPERGLFE